MTLNGVIAVILCYFGKFGSFWAHCVKVVEDVALKKYTFAISSPGKFLVKNPRADHIRNQIGRSLLKVSPSQRQPLKRNDVYVNRILVFLFPAVSKLRYTRIE